MMKLYMNPVSVHSRTIIMLCTVEQIAFEPVVINLREGEHRREPFLEKNPNGLIPVLDDEGFVLTESSAILKYVAEKSNSSTYPSDLKERARVNELMDWFNTALFRELGYHLVFPQIFPHHSRSTPEITAGTVEWGREKSEEALEVLDSRWQIFLGDRRYLTGDDLTIADLFGAEILLSGDLIGVNWSRYPNIQRWLNTMRELPGWDEVHKAFDGVVASLSDKKFTTIS